MPEDALRQQIAWLYRALEARGLVTGSSGNVSARLDQGMLITPTGAAGPSVTPESLVRTTLDGMWEGPLLPSSEWQMHAAIYARHARAQVIVHTHSDYATALASLRQPLPAFHYDVVGFGGAEVRCAPYATFGTPQLAQAASDAMDGRTACLLANHGMICHAATADAALAAAIRLEALARQYLIARAAGEPVLLDAAQVAAALARYAGYGQQPAEGSPA
jgi:L-fuculose-phosphate aldolase